MVQDILLSGFWPRSGVGDKYFLCPLVDSGREILLSEFTSGTDNKDHSMWYLFFYECCYQPVMGSAANS